MPIPLTPLVYRKAAGFVFSENETAKLAHGIMGDAYDPDMIGSGIIGRAVEEDKIGLFFYHVFQPEGKYESVPEDDIPEWIITLIVEDLGKGEALDNFSDIPLRENLHREEVQKAISWLEERGFSKSEVEKHWATLPEDCFRYFIYPESGEGPNPLNDF